ncbi:hypothetical protein PMPD1_1348 [Paramixta manurensis]|uniref:Bacterial CdiA-CT RNAse A domain-containing protein n=1 Tax=Paramixta manurensis TaxID=2740817 RepID=A0A6M8UCQ8_9GAMM|nr:hypothetical protein PMPD1_1348 [Erwiniaceae bacterium PD-1]
MDDNGLKMVMSPVQLAAVLSDKSVTEGETLSNRLYGGLGLLAGTLELVGSRAFCATPVGRVFTAACVIVGAHSMDTIQASINQIRTGVNTRTATYRLAVETAKKFGADDQTAWNVGMAVDVGVPIGFSLALGAARLASVRFGRITLIEHESATGFKPGGHTIAKHVGKSDKELIARFETERRIPVSSSFSNLRIAEDAISKAIQRNRDTIRNALSAQSPGTRLTIKYPTGEVIGYGFKRGSTQKLYLKQVRLTIVIEQFHGKPYYILTAFPDI